MTGTKLDAALDLIGRGFRIFPLLPNSKIPAIKGWKDKATRDPELAKQVWSSGDYNIGVYCEGMVVIDVDVKNGKPGMTSLLELELDLDTYTVRTPTGGLHVYYTGPNVGLSAGRIGSGLDVRSGGGYVVGAGSTLEGQLYAVVADTACRTAPSSLLERIGSASLRDAVVQAPATPLDTPAIVDRATAYLRGEAHIAIEGSGGDDTTFRVAVTLKDHGVSRAMAFDLMVEHWNDRCLPPWSTEELLTKVKNAYAYGKKAPGSESPEAAFRDVVMPPEPVEHDEWIDHGDPWDPDDEAWLFYEMLPATGVVVVTGPPQSGKTFLLAEMSRCTTTAKPFFGETVEEQGGVLLLYAGTEGSGLRARLKALQEDAVLPISALMLTEPLSAQGALAKLQAKIEAKAAAMLAKFGVPVRLVVIETLSSSGLLKDENDNSEAAAAMAVLAGMSRRMGALFVTSHHPPKDGKGSRGASALLGSADYVLEIHREGRTPVREVELTKARNAPQRTLGAFTLVTVDLGTDKRGRPVTSCVLSTGERRAKDPQAILRGDLFLSCVDFAVNTEGAPEIDGKVWGDKDDAYDYYRDRCGLSGKGNISNDFSRVRRWAEDMGRIEVMTDGKRTLFREKDPI